MPKKSKEKFENLIQIISSHPHGISIEEIINSMTNVVPRRTIQYRLSALVKSEILKIEGAGKSTKYHINKNLENKLPSEKTVFPETSIIPLLNNILMEMLSSLANFICFCRDFIFESCLINTSLTI